MDYREIQNAVYDSVIRAQDAGLVRLSAGNISARTADGHVAITPSGIQYSDLKAEQISIVDLDGQLISGPKPSSETPMHTAILRAMPEVQSVFHSHSPYAISFAMAGKDVPMVNLELFVCGAPIPVAPWASPGSVAAGEIVVEIFKQRPELKVVLLRKHGLVAIGDNLDQAYKLAYDAEIGMMTYFNALQLGKPEPLTAEQIQEIKDVYR
jgi:L-ribulose-5-phosphate 4-epimerase